MTGLRIEHLGEDALLVRLGDRIDAAVNARVHRLAATLQARRPAWLVDIVPAHATLALIVDLDLLEMGRPQADGLPPLERAEAWLRSQDTGPGQAGGAPGALEPALIPVRYGGRFGPDLEAVAARARLAPEAAITLHTGTEYRVAMLGFAPGFPYLSGLAARLSTPRRPTPRVRVAGGSVGIGGDQTGIYPREGPGGWNIIGRTPLRLFDPARKAPCVLAPGQPVRFRAIDDVEFERLEAGR